MSTAPSATSITPVTATNVLTVRLSDYVQLTKLRLSLLVLVVTAAGYALGADGNGSGLGMLHAVLGTALVAFAANALNQVIERRYDLLMPRTQNRPVAAGRIGVVEATTFSWLCAIGGTVYLSLATNLLAAALALVTFVIYIFVYTPMKRRTWTNTLIGAIPGALPPLIGYVAAGGSSWLIAGTLFAILYLWQMPHFYSIAWMYRADYAAGGYRMLSVVDPTGRAIARQSVYYVLALMVAAALPVAFVSSPNLFVLISSSLAVCFVTCVLQFAVQPERRTARYVLLASIAYLAALMVALLITF